VSPTFDVGVIAAVGSFSHSEKPIDELLPWTMVTEDSLDSFTR